MSHPNAEERTDAAPCVRTRATIMTIHGILLAAGNSLRMHRPKQLLPWQGRPLVRHVAETALASRLASLVVVVGAEATAVRQALAGLSGPITIVACPDYAQGLAASLRCGLGALPAATIGVVILLVDQPQIAAGLIDRLISAFVTAPEVPAVIPRYQGQRGNPVLLAAQLFAELQTLEGDVGARAILARYAATVRWLDVDDPAVVEDIDTPEAYERSQQRAYGPADERSSQ